jgi:putative inorganic carbon (HCO3(-)) transporter
MPMTPLRTLELGCVGAAVVLSAALFLPAAADPVNVVKLVAVLAAALGCLGAGVSAAVREREVDIPAGWFTGGLGLLLTALAVSAVSSPTTTTAVLGAPGRLSGLALYAACAVLAVSTLRGGLAAVAVVEAAVVTAGAFTGVYGLLQYLNLDPVRWANEFNPIIGALGNPNFASAYLGICMPLLLAWALRTEGGRRIRAAAAVVAACLFLLALLSGASQGPLAAAAGTSVVALAWLLDRETPLRQRGLVALGASAVVGVAALVAGAAGSGPAARLFGAGSFQTRQWYWQAALDMWQREPLLGVGIDHYGQFWRTSRPLENVRVLGGGDFSDAAHSVPLHLLATGGLVTAVAYIAFVLITAVALVHGLRTLRGPARLRLAGVGGAWAAYQVQSLVSIDQVPLVVLNFVLAAAVVAASGTGALRHVRLPGALPAKQQTASGRRRSAPHAQRVRVATPADLALLSGVGAVTLALLWFAVLPLRADVAVRSGDTALRKGKGDASLAAYERAIDLLPGRSRHWQRKADLLRNVQPATALQAYDQAIDADPSNVTALRAASRLAEEQEQLTRARTYHRKALTRDPYNSLTISEAAMFELRHGGAKAALQILEKAIEAIPEQVALWTPLGDARQVLGDIDGAIAAYREALRLDPTQSKAAEELARLQAADG